MRIGRFQMESQPRVPGDHCRSSAKQMTQWCVSSADILDAKADGLICSANPNLNLSGGVGGAFLLRYGTEMQDFLHGHLRSTRFPTPIAISFDPPMDTAQGTPSFEAILTSKPNSHLWGHRLSSRGRPVACSVQSSRNQYIRARWVRGSGMFRIMDSIRLLAFCLFQTKAKTSLPAAASRTHRGRSWWTIRPAAGRFHHVPESHRTPYRRTPPRPPWHLRHVRLAEQPIHPLPRLRWFAVIGQMVRRSQRVRLAPAELGRHVEHGRGLHLDTRQAADHLRTQFQRAFGQVRPLEEPLWIAVVLRHVLSRQTISHLPIADSA
jgi:hypothetical protein